MDAVPSGPGSRLNAIRLKTCHDAKTGEAVKSLERYEGVNLDGKHTILTPATNLVGGG